MFPLVWPELGRFQFNIAALNNLGITNVTISGNTDGMPASPTRLLAETLQAVRSATGASAGTGNPWPAVELEAAEGIAVDSWVFISGGAVYQGDDPSNPLQATRGWVDTAYSMGEPVSVNFAGVYDAPSGLVLPIGKDLFASPGGSLTWQGDTDDPLASNDLYLPMGKSFDTTTFYLNCLTPPVGRVV